MCATKKTISPFQYINFILAGCLFFILCNFLASCKARKEETKASHEEGDKRGGLTAIDSLLESDLAISSCNTVDDPKPILRLGKLINTSSGWEIIPVRSASVGRGNVHVITHGWAPHYLTAVRDYKKNYPEGFLKAWDSQAKETKQGKPIGDRFFVDKLVPLAQSIRAADPGSTVLCFSWIDHSATSAVDDPGQSEKCTAAMGYAMFQALEAAFTPGMSRKLHFLGHSHGTKVVTVAGIFSKRKNSAQIIHLTLFDSPERAFLIHADNKLRKILPAFSPNRTNRFVENYISYYGACYNQYEGLNPIIDITLRPGYHGCWHEHLEECITCAHEYGITWYTGETNARSGFGLGWSPLLNPSGGLALSGSYLQNETSVEIARSDACDQKAIYSCEDVLFNPNTIKKTN